MINLDLLKKLCDANGVSGFEDEVREIIIKEIKEYADDIKIDSIGNVIAFKKGKQKSKNKILLSAHMDEVGFIVKYIEENGTLRVVPVGGIDRRVISGTHMTVGGKVSGVFGIKPVHLCTSEEKDSIPKMNDMYIDIGAKNKEEASKYVSIGDYAAFKNDFMVQGDSVMSKALDDRIGCYLLIEILKSELPYDMYFAFVVQEEVGLRGATVATYGVNPDSAIVVEGTTAADIQGIDSASQVCKVGEGAVISFMDGATIYDKEYYNFALNNGAKTQIKKAVAGGNDAGIIHKTRNGVRTIAVSLACRYIHSQTSLASVSDIDEMHKTIVNTINLIAEQ